MKKTIALLLAVLMLLTIPMVVSADTAVIDPKVLNSITADDETGNGLAFLYNVNATGVAVTPSNVFLNNNAKVQYNGAEVKLVAMGAVLTNNTAIGLGTGENGGLVRENANGNTVLDIGARVLYALDETTCTFAVRIIHIETSNLKKTIYARPYFVVEVNGVEETVYGEVSEKSHFSAWCDSQPAVELPDIGTDIDVKNQKKRICVSAATIVDRTVTLTFQNYTTNWITEETDWVQYTAYDADGNKLETDKIYIGCIDTKKYKVKSFTFDVPDNTAEVKLTDSKIVYWTEWS